MLRLADRRTAAILVVALSAILGAILGWVACSSVATGSLALLPRARVHAVYDPGIVPSSILSDALHTELNGLSSDWAHVPELLAAVTDAILRAKDSGTALPGEPPQVADARGRQPSLQPQVRYVILRYSDAPVGCNIGAVSRDITELALVGNVGDASPLLFICTVGGQWYQIETGATMDRLSEYGDLVRQWELEHSGD